MTMEEAIKIIDCYDIGFYDLSGEKIPADKLADAFNMAIEALEHSQWIPCSEKLPSDGGNYLITVADLRLGHIGEHTVTMAEFYVKEKKWNSAVDVYAWMPLPEPWKGTDDE